MIARIDDVLNIYEKHIYKGCKNKRKIYLFEKYKMTNIINICNILNNGYYKIKKYNIFLVKYPKYRIVMSLNISDKIINHYMTIYYLIPKLSKYLNPRNIATRKNMGVDYGIKLVKKYLEFNKKYDTFFALKLDISKYFYNIDHTILKNMIKDKLDDFEYNILSNIIDSTNSLYINTTINSLKINELKHTNRIKEVNDMPYYKYDKGLPIGNMTSQFFAIFYLYELDHYIVNNLKIKYMVRYMDDFILIHNDKNYLKHVMKEIEKILNNKYKLNLNVDKSKIYNIVDGFDFLGYKFKVVNKKTICEVSNKTIKSVKKRIKLCIKLYTDKNFESIYSSINNYYYGFKYDKSNYIKEFIDNTFFI